MRWLRRLQEFAAFTKNEQRVFLFLALVFLVGFSIRTYKAYFAPVPVRHFDYAALDKEFAERSQHLTSLSAAGQDTSTSPASRRRTGSIDLNKATKGELTSLPGIGEGIAEQILMYREQHGPFSTVDQLRNIKGIGAKKLERIRPHVVIK